MKRLEKIALGTVVFGVVVVGGFFVVQSRNASRRSAAWAKFPIPERVERLRGAAPQASEISSATPEEESSAATFERVTHALYGAQSEEWRALMQEWRRPEERRDGFWQRCAQEIAGMQDALAAIRVRAADGGSLGEVTFEKAPYVYFTHTVYVQSVSETLAVDADVAARSGDIARAIDDIVATMQFADALAGDPVHGSHRARWHAYHLACIAVGTIPAGELTPVQAGQLIELLAAADRRDEFADSFAGEMLINKPYFEQPELLVEPYEEWAAYLGVNEPMHVLYNTPLGKPLLYSDEAVYLEMMKRMADAAREPYYKAFPQIAEIQYELHKMPTTRVLARRFLFRASGSLQQQAEHEARLDITQLGLAVELYHAEHGAYPPNLESVAHYLPDGLPLDVFTGSPYIYRTNVDPFLLYGVGSDRADHGGKVARDYRDTGDIVWRGSPPNE